MLTTFQQFGAWDNIEKGKEKPTITNCFKVCGRDYSKQLYSSVFSVNDSQFYYWLIENPAF